MGSRGIQKETGDEIFSEINVIPLVDISLVLLIIFMATANYIMTSSFTVDIPKATHVKNAQADDTVTISISPRGTFYFENDLVSTNDLKRKIEGKYRENPKVAVILSVDEKSNFKNVVAVLDLLGELGITMININASTE
jgi:biopolymer transport protein ExbD